MKIVESFFQFLHINYSHIFELLPNSPIATAFIATLWGVFSANIFWLPIADKLKQCHLEEKYMMEVSLEGVLAIQSGEIPSIVKSRLMSLLPQKEQGSIGIV